MGEPPVVAFLSTGRCGTQWLTAGLRERHPEIDVDHEPIGPLYRPRLYFRCYEAPEAMLEVPDVARHLERIERATRPYVETGWPLFSALPLLAKRLGDRLRVVHLTRHPVPSALSHLAQNSYAGSPRDDAYTRLATLGPSDRRVFQPEYAGCWERLSPYRKCLFWWTEVHMFGLEFERRRGTPPFIRIRSEDLLSGRREPLERLLDFMRLSWDERWIERTRTRVDRWHHHTDQEVDPFEVLRHPKTLKLARALGYEVEQIDPEALRERYHGRAEAGLDRIGRFAT